MKKLMLFVPFFCMVSVAVGEVSTRVCVADGNTPVELPVPDANFPHLYGDFMVGTKLTFIVSSDANGYWVGDLVIEGEDRDYGMLSARDYNEVTRDWEGSRSKAAGDTARVWDWEESGIDGFNLSGDIYGNAVPGDWFIIDYTATNIGDCNVGFYEYDPPTGNDILINYLGFTHVRTRDFDKSTNVDFSDFAILASYWRESDCNDPDWCGGADLDTDGNVDFNDVKLFTGYWLEETDKRCYKLGFK